MLRYGIGQQYKVHADTIVDPEAGVRVSERCGAAAHQAASTMRHAVKSDGGRNARLQVATVLVYLNEPEDGGETAFPMSEWINPELEKQSQVNFSACAKVCGRQRGRCASGVWRARAVSVARACAHGVCIPCRRATSA